MVIVCNTAGNEMVTMTCSDDDGRTVKIPSVMITFADADVLRAVAHVEDVRVRVMCGWPRNEQPGEVMNSTSTRTESVRYKSGSIQSGQSGTTGDETTDLGSAGAGHAFEVGDDEE